jgi:CRISPR system Cascade subunit CasA
MVFLSNPFSFEIVKLPDIDHQDNFLEPMTLWKYNLSGENKGHFTPRKHTINQSLWRSFGLLTITNDNQIKPAILEWLDFLSEELGDCFVELNAISMQDDGNATSWVPTDEIIDSLYINEFVLTDLQENGWVVRINDVVEETKKVISTTYKRFVEDVREIRNISSNGFTTQKVEDLYFRVDKPFRNWLSSIQIYDEKDMKIREWQKILKRLVRSEADNLLKEGSSRDYIGIVNKEKGTVKNIATAYETFNHWLIQSMK